MKVANIIVVIGLLFISNITFANTQVSKVEETLRVELNKLIGNESFTFESIKVTPSEKQISGQGTFFGKSGVNFKVAYHSETSLASFSATLPSKSKVSISNKELQKLAGQKLQDFIPNALKKGIRLSNFGFSFSKETKKVEKTNLGFKCLDNWEFFSGSVMSLENITVDFFIDNPLESEKRKLKSQLTGFTQIGNVDVDLTAILKKEKEQLQLFGNVSSIKLQPSLQTIVGKTVFKNIPVPSNILDLNLKSTEVTIAPYQDWMILKSNSNLGNVDVFVKKNEKAKKKKDKKLFYSIVISPPKGFKMSKINDKLSIMDGLDLSSQKIVISSEKKSKKETSKIPSLAQVKSGFNKGCNFVANLDVTKLKLEHIIGVKNLIVNSPLTDKLNDVVLEGPIETNIKIGPAAELKNVLFRLQPSPKNFAISLIGVMDTKVDKDLLEFNGGMEVVLSDQKLNFMSMMKGDWNNPLGAKGLTMSDVGVQMGASFAGATILPNVALAGKIEIGNFDGSAAVAFDSRNPEKSMMAVSFDKIVLMDLLNLVVDKKITKSIPRDMKNMLREFYLQDVAMEMVPTPVKVLDKSYDAGFRASGKMSIAGFNGEMAFDIDYRNGIMFRGTVDPIDLKVFKLKGANGNKRPGFILDLRKGKNPKMALNGMVNVMGIEAEADVEILPNGFKFLIGGKIFNVFDGEIYASGTDMAKAGDMQLQVKMNNDLLGFIDREATKIIENSTEGAIKKLTKAQNAVNNAKNHVNKLDKDIAAARKEVVKKQSKNRAKYNAAKRTLDKWQNDFSTIKGKIRKYEKEAKRANPVKKAWLKTKIAGLKTTKASIWVSLEGAQKVFDGLKWVNKNPDLDPKVAKIIATKKTALVTLEGTEKSLEALKWTLGAVGKAGTFIVKNGSKALINVRKADFAGRLGTVHGGSVKLNLDLEWLGKKQNIKFNFNMKNPKDAVKDLAKKLMDLK